MAALTARWDKRLRSARSALALVLVAWLIAAAPAHAPALAKVPPDLASQIANAATAYRTRMELSATLARNPTGSGLARVVAGNARRAAVGRLAGAVAAGISRNPALTRELAAAAASAAPDLRADLSRRLVLSFPVLAAEITAGVSGAALPATAPPRPTPPRLPPPPRRPVAAAGGEIPPPPLASAARPLGPRLPAARSSPAESPPAESMAESMSASMAEAEADEEAEAALAAIEAGAAGAEENDPLEGFNRAMFFINDTLDGVILRPLAWLYGEVMPEMLKKFVRNGFRNLKSPVVLANDLLQLEFENAAVTLARFFANSTLGVGGLFEVAEGMGLAHHSADFGQTLHSYGVGAGPYLVLPILGPATTRHAFGQIVDVFLHPLNYMLDTEENLMLFGDRTLVEREDVLEETDELRKTSLDYYAAIRSLYYQNRAQKLHRGGDGNGREEQARLSPPPDLRAARAGAGVP